MKLRLWIAIASAVLLLVPASVIALQTDGAQNAGMSGSATMQQNANESAQATTDMSYGESVAPATAVRDVSYGGVTAGQSQMGGPSGQSCNTGVQCKVYFGH
ncbi:hypothetical protein [Paraburkholderia sp. BCC1884]|uniref:hypothetical protein n=1 Tax=Paraburkholderia sp. BCC1884 TaxID=2562668 RepID=UPI00118438A8|nr:hypothetical protein [Paraburkholderia sp. BCC1884]